jgi:hypothetical protein
MLSKFVILTCLILPLILKAQNDLKFESKESYLAFLKSKFDINKSDVFYHGVLNDSAYFGRVSLMVFTKGSMMTTVEEMQEREKSLCSPKTFMKYLTIQRIENAFTENKHLSAHFFKNIATDSTYTANDNITALFFYSYKFKSKGLQYFRHKEYLEKLNIKCIMVSLDEAEIKGLANNNSQKVIIQ